MGSGLVPTRPAGIKRPAARAPIWLCRLRLGRLLGHRALLPTHRGRRTGRERQVVLEVAHDDPATRESTFFAGWRGETDSAC